jgi:hypothetical protein
MRLGSIDTPVPFNKKLEDAFLPPGRLDERIRALLTW